MFSQSYAQENWTVWYRDTFDHEAPARIDVSGKGLTQGLAELWARYLFETVQASGQQGFSRFHLEWGGHGFIQIEGDWQGAKRLRFWLFGNKHHSYTGYVKEADPALLEHLANSHIRLIGNPQATHHILSIAAIARDAEDFASRLDQVDDAPAAS